MSTALAVTGLSVRRRREWTLRDCSVAVPSGCVAALVGPNGAGKSTLLHTIVGLLTPAAGTVTVSGDLAFMAQEKPLYDGFTVAEMLTFGRRMNPGWDDSAATGRLAELDIPLDRKIARLSGGQQAQVGLTLALARRPSLLILDEPLANLDPLARHDVTRAIMTEVAERQITVLLSSHIVTELRDICDWLIVLNGGRVQVSGDIDDLLAGHLMLSGPAELADGVASTAPVVSANYTGRQASLLVKGAPALDPRWSGRHADLEELVMAYLRSPHSATIPKPAEVSA